MARFSAALYLAADNEPHEIPIFSPANYSLNVDLHLRTLQQYIGPLVKLLYDYNGIDFHLFTNLIRCDGWRKLFINEMSMVLQTTTCTCSSRRARTLRSTSFYKTRRWGYGTTRNSISTYTLPIVVKLTFALRTAKFVKCQSLFKIYKHVNVL